MDTGHDALLKCWGKTGETVREYHPALFHMVDTGQVARRLLEEGGSPRWRKTLALALSADEATLASWLPWMVAMHDIGKVSAAFQSSDVDQASRLTQEGFALGRWSDEMRRSHPAIGQVYLVGRAAQADPPTRALIGALAEAVGGHHGRYCHPDDDVRATRRRLAQEAPQWQALRIEAEAELRRALLQRDVAELREPANLSSAVMALTGFVILCDWLGSDARFFGPAPDSRLPEYLSRSSARAADALRQAGLLAATTSSAPADPAALLKDLGPARPLQTAIGDIPAELLCCPTLTIIEAPTGEGKTEAALALARRIAHSTGSDEFYYALPTMATSNQMFGRLQEHLSRRLGLPASVKLVHGQAFLVEKDLADEFPAALMSPHESSRSPAPSGGADAVTWFNSKKRSLIAPFGVGTVDQAELAALNVKHASLRMMGLAGKVVIVDEVHAYDVYMTTIIERLLRWLAELGASAILLSATLPLERRRRLAEAYGGALPAGLDTSAYPGLVVVPAAACAAPQPAWRPAAQIGVCRLNKTRTVNLGALHFSDEQASAKAAWLLEMVCEGGVACWVCNTVRRAQDLFAELRRAAPPDVRLKLLHAQFPADQRRRVEAELTQSCGPGDRPPEERCIVVGTQVLEQSLDLDFDVMVSDLAPIDLLLQRSGRLHRHARVRPRAHCEPHLWLGYEKAPGGDLKLGSDRTIYHEYLMRKTHELLAARSALHLPGEYRLLIEAVYSETAPEEGGDLYGAWRDLKAAEQMATREACQRLLPAPHPRDSFARSAALRVRFEEDENRADWIVAQTRLGRESLNIVVLDREGDWVCAGGAAGRLSVHEVAPPAAQRLLLRSNMHIGDGDAIAALRKESEEHPTDLFTKSTLLKGYYPLWLSGRQKRIQVERRDVCFQLDPELGLIIRKEARGSERTR